MKPVPRPRLPRRSLLALLCALAAADMAAAAGASAQASATVLEPVAVKAWLGVALSVEQLLLAQQSPAGPAIGGLVARVPATGAPPTMPRVPLAWIADVVEARTAFAIDMVPGAGLLPAGPAATITAAATGDGESPLVITVAFN